MPSSTALVALPFLLVAFITNFNTEQIPLQMLVRNIFLSGQPEAQVPLHTSCVKEDLGSAVTIVVSVKDACTVLCFFGRMGGGRWEVGGGRWNLGLFDDALLAHAC
jgi:hypothetical protein